MSRKYSKTSWISGLPLFVGLLATTLSVSARAQSTEFPTYQIGMNQNASTGPSYTAPLSNPSMHGLTRILNTIAWVKSKTFPNRL